ncbi:MAG: hypothetical protein ACE5JU_07895 [Candidatus Binatia bacterium]
MRTDHPNNVKKFVITRALPVLALKISQPFATPPTGQGLLRVDGDPFDFAQGHREEDRTVSERRTT